MVAHKNITKIVSVMVAAAVLFCIAVMVFPEKAVETFGGGGVALQYESELFDTDEIIRIDIQMDEEQWEDMVAHASQEEYYSCDVVINDTKLHNVGIRPKGNTSLSSIVMDPDTDRFSLKMEFDHYVAGQTCFGLDKLILNNNYADATNMKEALVYDMYGYLEADASLYNYAEICVNGKYWGVYLALEGVEDSFQLRNYGTADGELYKPESMGMGGGPGGQRPFFGGEKGTFEGRGPQDVDWGEMPEEADLAGRGERPDGERMPGGGPSMGGSGADLNYTDDELDSYSTIWEGEVTNTGKSDHRRVVTALKNISQGTDPEKYLDVDNLLKYMAVHVFSVNLDSLSGVMAHNYYLYEYNGRLNILPWDYNLSFGGMDMGAGNDASGVVNDAIDTPFQATKFFDVLLEDEAYLARYHEYMERLVEEYVFGGGFDRFYDRVRNQIDELVETDPTAFYSFDEYEAGAEMLYRTVLLRAESIRGQLDGTIPSTDAEQRADSSGLIDASSINIDVMGVFNRGRNGGENGFPGHGEDQSWGFSQKRDIGENQEPQENEPAQEVFHDQSALPGNGNRFSDGGDMGNMPDGQHQRLGAAGDRIMPGEFGHRDTESMIRNVKLYGICLLAAILALIAVRHYERVPKRK